MAIFNEGIKEKYINFMYIISNIKFYILSVQMAKTS